MTLLTKYYCEKFENKYFKRTLHYLHLFSSGTCTLSNLYTNWQTKDMVFSKSVNEFEFEPCIIDIEHSFRNSSYCSIYLLTKGIYKYINYIVIYVGILIKPVTGYIKI